MPAVASVEPSSTTMISSAGQVCASTESMARAMNAAAL
jgi:hypothetical protein